MSTLQVQMEQLAKGKKEQIKDLRGEYGSTPLGVVTVNMVLGGMRGIKGIVCETSLLDEQNGITYRGHTLKECMEKLPKAPGSKIGLPEASFWLLLTGQMPTDGEVQLLQKELHRRSTIPEDVLQVIDGLDPSMHPMTQLSMGLLALQPRSKFGNAYRDGTLMKKDYWIYVLEDALTLVAQIPIVAARIFRNVYFEGKHIASDPSLDWAANYAKMLGVSDKEDFLDITRLYLMLHADHEGGNVSAHATHLVGSALSDPFQSYAAGVMGLAGPLHGLANQECLRWLRATKEALGDKEPTVANLTKFAQDTLKAGKVIPGFGHGVLRASDPRYLIQREFAQEHFPNDPLVILAEACFQAIPPVLQATGKVANPWPNVDALSGTLMQAYGVTQEDYYTVLFAVSRSIGCMSSLVWSRLLGFPIERPKSVTLEWLKNSVQ
eukprot:CAMPEP_0170581784 /NCGR_PEP_ID=MMETSP0224-20130122/7227_1 /TAXON_ID=285029 /ORGANISM="Togula jolla, Strain CCCM 725" /LENGTH=435 /DNA_ID=CAMNT_0010904949 /DNA_START=116 /DNA_END=1423 /DNA_ORIENTATION=-